MCISMDRKHRNKIFEKNSEPSQRRAQDAIFLRIPKRTLALTEAVARRRGRGVVQAQKR